MLTGRNSEIAAAEKLGSYCIATDNGRKAINSVPAVLGLQQTTNAKQPAGYPSVIARRL